MLIAYSPLQIKIGSFSHDEGNKKENIPWTKKSICVVGAILQFSILFAFFDVYKVL